MQKVISGLAPVVGGLFFVLALAGCQTTKDAIGTGRLVLSAPVADYLEDYLDDHNPVAFAVTTDGQCATIRYCPTLVGSCLNEDINFFAIKGCESHCKKSCKVLALERRIVWDGPVAGLPENVRRPNDPAATPLGRPFV